jgi:type VI secretion system protein ImpM
MTTTSSTPGAPGWYGKLPTLGDFASRRLPAEFIEAWDGWLAEGIAGLRQSAGDAWLDAYLASPVWRFVLMPGALGAGDDSGGPRAGVLMPSVDRVGRYFPLTLMSPINAPSSGADVESLLGWLHRLDDAAADALHDDWDVDTLEEELARLSPPSNPSAATGPATDAAATAGTPLDPLRALAIQAFAPGARSVLARDIALGAAELWLSQARGLSFWLAETSDAPPRLLVCRGLPRAARFAELFGAALPSATTPSAAAPFSLAD